jgi:hypothetical protein
MNSTLSRISLAAALAAGSLPAFAATPVGDYLSFSGFGTLGGALTNTDDAQFIRDRQAGGANKSGSLTVDSDFGLQLTATATPWLSATAQMLSLNRDGKSLSTEVEWAFVKVKPVNGLAIRAGRMSLPTFAVSDSRNVGYVNNWLRAPGEVYGLAMLGRLEGADVSYSAPVGATTLTVSALGGKSSILTPGGDALHVTGVRGVNVLWETEWATLRLGQIRSHVHVPALGIVDSYTFTGAGVTVDHDNIFAQAEFVKRRSSGASGVVDANGWYVMGGYRFDQLLPYASYASSKPHIDAPYHLAGPQHTAAIGLRWDAAKSLDIKAQLERINTDGTPGVSFTGYATKPVTAVSLAADFVF